MNLLLGISLPLASQQKNFFKVSARLLNQNDFNPLRCQGILKHFALQSKVVKPLSLQSDFIDKNLNINDGFIKKNNTGPLKQKIGLNPNEISLFGLRNKQCKKIGEFICAVSFKASLNYKKKSLVRSIVFAKPSLCFFQSAGKHNCSIRHGIHSTMVFHDQSSAGLQLTDKGTVKPSEIFSLLGLDAQNLTDSPLEAVGVESRILI